MVYEQFKKLNGKKHDRRIKAVIGISLSKFNILLVAFVAAYDAIQLERCQKGEIKQVPTGRPKGHHDTFERKLFFLMPQLPCYGQNLFHTLSHAFLADDYICRFPEVLAKNYERHSVLQAIVDAHSVLSCHIL